jgi:hypothetical protein
MVTELFAPGLRITPGETSPTRKIEIPEIVAAQQKQENSQ